MSKEINVIQYGIGPIGLMITRFLSERERIKIVGAVDNDPLKIGKDLGELAGIHPLNIKVTGSLNSAMGIKPDAVILTTSSSLEKIKPQVLEILSHGINIVSTCEELVYPWITNPAAANEIDTAAKKCNAAVLSTGVNPGFLMDFLPLSLTAVCTKVNKITVERIQDAQFRRIPFQKKIGAGLTVEEFHQKVKEGSIRHVGLTESIHMIASGIGLQLDRTEDKIEPVIAEETFANGSLVIEKGRCLGVKQTGRGLKDNTEVITLNFTASVGQQETGERIIIDGTPPVDLTIKNGINGDTATCAIAVNAVSRIINASPGLRTMADIEPLTCI